MLEKLFCEMTIDRNYPILVKFSNFDFLHGQNRDELWPKRTEQDGRRNLYQNAFCIIKEAESESYLLAKPQYSSMTRMYDDV